MDDFVFTGVDEAAINREKAKARELRKSSWWKNRIAAGICYYCGGKFLAKELTMDHLIPLARGGTSSKGNLVPACKGCNNKKKTLLPLEWEEYMATLDRRA
ncbi:MAG: HNH endonuclease [Deltaproteobacteria bacterium]|nr:HNH endonuclease [Deltaproteobacteria bacterium]